MHPTGTGPQRLGGIFSANAAMAGYPKTYNIEMDPHEDLNVAGLFGWVGDPVLKAVARYEQSVKEHPLPDVHIGPPLSRLRASSFAAPPSRLPLTIFRTPPNVRCISLKSSWPSICDSHPDRRLMIRHSEGSPGP
jgi:hypothetical protein